jgi:hypothetical protein
MATAATNAGENNNTNSNNNEQMKVTYTPEQQAHIEALIKEKQGEAGRQAKAEAETLRSEMAALKQELADAKAAMSSARTNKERQEAGDDVQDLMQKIAEMKAAGANREAELTTLRSQLADKDRLVQTERENARNTLKSVEIQKATSKVGFIDSAVVEKLTSDRVKWDEVRNKFIVINDSGTERMNASYEPMTLEEFYTEFASKNPYLAKGDIRGGVGSSESREGLSRDGKFKVEDIFGPKSSSKSANDLYRSNPSEYHRLKAIAKSNGLL